LKIFHPDLSFGTGNSVYPAINAVFKKITTRQDVYASILFPDAERVLVKIKHEKI
jgi:hypothetical protein